MDYRTIQVRFDDDICFIEIHRPDHNNTINDTMVEEFTDVLAICQQRAKIVVLQGSSEVFSFGADFKTIQENSENEQIPEQNPEPLYKVWQLLGSGPYVTVAHVRGKVNAGGVGFVAACDIVLCQQEAVFSLSELLFGLMPACVLPFLIRKTGFSRAHYLTLMTQPFSAKQALEWGLADDIGENSENLLRKHLLRLRRLNKPAIERYKRYMNQLNDLPSLAKSDAISANIEVFSDQENLEKITRFVKTGQFPWE